MDSQATQIANQIQSFSPDQFSLFVHNSLISSVTDSLKLSEIIHWYQDSDRKTLATAYKNYLSTDLTDSLSGIQKPVLILGTCGSFKAAGINEDKVKDIFQMQYKNVKKCTIKISAKSHHFIMFDDFNWMISNVESFINS